MSSQHRSPEPSRYNGPPWPVALCAVLMVVGLLAAGVVLAEAGWTSDQIIGLLTLTASVAGGLLATLGKLMAEHRVLVEKQDEQSSQIRQIAWNTNGHLKSIVRQAVADALQDKEIRQEPPSSTSDGDPTNLAA